MNQNPKLKIQVAEYSDVGGREVNEDSKLVELSPQGCFIAVADGLGGHGMGDIASQTVCRSAFSFSAGKKYAENSFFDDLYSFCQNELINKQKSLGAEGKMRTTLNLLAMQDGFAYWNHIGDTRTYYFENGKLIRRTSDHSVPQALASSHQITENMIRFHEDRNRLLKAMGVENRPPEFDAEEPIELVGNQQFLLCTDGFWEYINEEQMILCLNDADDPQFWLDNMLELVSRNQKSPGCDNFTAVAVWIGKEQGDEAK